MEATLTKTETKFKNLTWFFVASTSLMLSGFLIARIPNYVQLSILIWSNFVGVFLIYRLNDCIDQDKDLKFNLKSFFSYRLHQVIVAQFVLVVIPLSLIYLDPFIMMVLTTGAILGTVYSINFNLGEKQFRIKNIFLVKNVFIGLVWGSLVLLGAGTSIDPVANSLFIFASIQVFLGGMIRDIPDLEKDKGSGVKSFPVVIGIPKTIVFMHLINLGSFFILFTVGFDIYGALIFGVPVLWRVANLMLLQKEPNNLKWSQWMNLFTCVVILLMLLILMAYEHFWK